MTLRIIWVIAVYKYSRIYCWLTNVIVLGNKNFLTVKLGSSHALLIANRASSIVEKPLLRSITSIEQSDLVLSILAAISVKILLGLPKYNTEASNITSILLVIEAPLEGRGRVCRTEREG